MTLSALRIAIIVFPGSNCDRDMMVAIEQLTSRRPALVWHKEALLDTADLVIIPGGFSFGDYLRCGALAGRSPIMNAVLDHAARGGAVMGICNGFQVLTELGLLPGALTRNCDLHFICENAPLQVASERTPWMETYGKGQPLSLPIAHGEGRYQCSADTLKQLQDDDAIALRYCRNPNGSIDDIAGITNEKGNILGLMPHPERACDPLTGGLDGQAVMKALLC